MHEIGRWLREATGKEPGQVLAVVSASVVAVAAISCIVCLALATIAGTLLINRPKATEEVASHTAEAAPEVVLTDAATPAMSSQPAETSQLAGSSAIIETPELSPTPDSAPVMTETTELVTTTLPITPLEATGLLPPADEQLSTTTIEPMDVPPPDNALELTPTIQLTLSSVIFVENVGQFFDSTRFHVRGAQSGGIWLEPAAVWLTLVEPAASPPGLSEEGEGNSQPASPQGVHLRLSFVGANPTPQLVPFDRLDTQVSYFSGVDPAGWYTQVPVWGGVRYQNIYPGVDLELTSEEGQYIQRLIAHPGADLSAVRLRVDGAERLALELLPAPEDGAGEGEPEQAMVRSALPGQEQYYLRLTTVLGEFTLPLLAVVTPDGSPLPEPAPPAPQITTDSNVVEFPFLLSAEDESVTRRGRADTTPAPSSGEATDLLYTAFAGRGGSTDSYAIAVDGRGCAFVTGRTYVPAFPLAAGAFDASSGGTYDAFIVKLKPSGSEMAYGTFMGGSDDEAGYAITLDKAGNAYLTGVTNSSDLPTTAGAFDTSYDGGTDAFVAKVGVTGAELDYVTFLGGSETDWGRGIAVDGIGNAHVTGATQSADFPATTGAWDTTGDGQDAFVVKVNAVGSGLVYSTFLGGMGADRGNATAVDGQGHAYVTGSTQSPDFPTTGEALDPNHSGGDDAFVVQLDETGIELVYATFLGGREVDRGNGIAVDSAGSAYVAGSTRSSDFPTTSWGFDISHDGGQDAFVVKLGPGGSTLKYASFLGNNGDDWAQAIAVDDMNQAYVTGSTQSFGQPEASQGLETSVDTDLDAFVVRIDELGTELAYITSVGGMGQEWSWDLAVDRMGSVYMTGVSESPDFASRPSASRPNDLGPVPQQPAKLRDAFIVKLVAGTPFLDLPVSYSEFAQAALGNMSDRGPGRVNSWFDHSYPDHTQNQRMVRWDGQVSRFSESSPPLIGESWYDGHGGTDFGWETKDEPIYAAAPGTVIDTYTACREGDQACGSYFGNRVWIDHGNGYATVYAHLGEVHVSEGMMIDDPGARSLGTMGNTGRSQGTHLHFALYFDQNGDGQWARSESIDPYGWAGTGKDPWGSPSRYLWKSPLWSRQVVSDTRTTLESPSGQVSATVPGTAFDADVLVELWDLPSEVLLGESLSTDSTGQWRSSGHKFRLTATRLDRDAQPGVETDSSIATAQPVTLTIAYRKEDLRRLDPDQLVIRRWDETQKAWIALPTTVDANLEQATAQTMELGSFDLHAPLLCSTDPYEPDDHYASAATLKVDGLAVRRAFEIGQDHDWFRVEAKAGGIYVAETTYPAEGVDTVLSLHNLATLTTLISSDSRRHGGTSYLKWRAPQDGSYLLRVSRAGGSAYGCNATYVIKVRQVHPPEQVAIAGPKTGVVETVYAFTAAVSPTTVSRPVSYSWQLTTKDRGSSSPYQEGLTLDSGNTITFTWDTTGTHQIVVTATNEGGIVTGTHSIAVFDALSAAFTASPLSGTAPLEVEFVNTSSPGYTESWWEFGDSKASRTENPSHTYKAPGVYTVTLTISGLESSDTITKTAYIEVRRPAFHAEQIIYLPFVFRDH